MPTMGAPAQLNVPQAESLTLKLYRVEVEKLAKLTHSGDSAFANSIESSSSSPHGGTSQVP